MNIVEQNGKSQSKSSTLVMILLLACAAMFIQGYHPGAEDDGVYLAAIHSDLKPGLFPFDSQFFRVQLQASIYDRMMAVSSRVLHLPVNVTMFLWQFAALCLVLYASLRIARLLFRQTAAQWSAVVLLAVLFALPVAGTALFLIDPQLHPRTLATVLILLAAEAVLHRPPLLAVPLLFAAAFLHPIMAAFGMSFCLFLILARPPQGSSVALAALAAPDQTRTLSWLLDKPTPEWRLAMGTRNYIFLSGWAWYEWLGVFAPMLLLAWCWRWARDSMSPARVRLARLTAALVAYSLFQLAFAVVVAATPALVRLLPLQPMRFLHLVYLLGVLVAGGLLGEFLLHARAWRWCLAFLPLALVMFLAQRSLFPATPHLELPGISDGSHSSNPWLQAFAWIANNTPQDAYFALDPNYMELRGEDYHGFRALAQRSILADSMKDSAVAMQVPRLAPIWLQQVNALQGFNSFQAADFTRLHRQFGVTWAVLPANRHLGMDCPYRNAAVQVCRIQY
jgi:hypothetical protein